MEAAVGSVIGATVENVLRNLLSISGKEIKLTRNFKKDLGYLKRSFAMIQNVLQDAEMQEVTNRAVNLWLKNLESVAFEADNVLDEINYHVLLNKNENNMMEKVKTYFFHKKMARKIKDINEELKSINQEPRDFGLQEMKPVGAGFDLVASRETDPFTADPIVLGREYDVSNIVEMLTTSPAKQVFSVLPIVGMGGLGKTTLARQVLNHEKIKAQFEKQIWVYVSRNFDAMILFKKILESLTQENVQLGNRGVLLEKIQQHLGAKRYLLVLDDLWNESRVEWDDFLNSLSGISFVKGNSIIVTTRSQNVASIVKTLPIYKLKGLSEEECWSVIRAKAFREGEDPSEFETIGRNIANRCKGLPLAAKVVGGLLCEKSKDEWLVIEKTWLSNFGEDENAILKVLKFSFDHLSLPSLKKCFAYCSIFPKGDIIEKEQLIELWMAEGFLATDQSNDMEIVGNNFFNLLVKNSLLQVEEHCERKTKCTMHDLVHDLASSILGSKSNCVNDQSLDDIYQVRYVVLESIRDDSLPMPKQQARCVRTLIFSGEVSDNMLLHFKSLHALILMSPDVKEFPSLITELIHLRLLDISHTSIKCLPDSISKLCHLQTLRAENFWMRLPNALKYLTCLRHLHIGYLELPPGIGRLTSLQTLPYFLVGYEKGCRIGELGSLKNLKGELAICNLERVDDKEEAKSAYLIQKPNIVKLNISWDELREGEINDENVLEGLQPHPNLKSLEISGFKGRCFPLWTLKMEIRDDLGGCPTELNNLMEIRLINCKKCEEIPMLGHLPNLKSLYLNGLTNVSSIGFSIHGIGNCSMSSSSGVGKNTIFPALERLELSNMLNLIEWVEPEFPSAIVVFPLLKYLEIHDCAKLRELPDGLHSLHLLEEFSITLCPNLKSIPYPSSRQSHQGFTNLRTLTIDHCDGLTHLPSELIESCAPSLEELNLNGLSSLTNLPMVVRCLHKMPRFKDLVIVGVPIFTDFSMEIGPLDSLRNLVFLPSSSHALDYTLLQEFLDNIFRQSRSLHSLFLFGMEHWDSLPSQLQYLTALHLLQLSGFGIEALPEWLGNMSSLRKLALSNCQKLRRLPSKEAMQRLTYLTELSIHRCPELNVKRCNEQQSDDSQWPNISHIHSIVFDGKRISFGDY